jgi:hypothetical protein
MSEQFPANVRAVRDAFVAKVPVPAGGPNPADSAFEDRCRAWTRSLAQQIVFSTNDRSWGCKNAGGGRPQSKDALAHQVGGNLFGFDLLFGVGTGSPSLVPSPSGEDITGQVFMPVDPVDHLGGAPAPGPAVAAPTGDLAPRVAALEAAVKAADSKIQDALRTAAEAVAAAQDAVRQAQAALAKMGTLRAKGSIDVPVVVENLSRARAKGDVDLALE